MIRLGVRLWTALVFEAGVAVALVVAHAVAVRPSPAAAAIGAAAGAATFAAAARRRPRLAAPARARLPLVAGRGGILLVKSSSEEVLWRGLALVRLAAVAGLPIAAAAATAGFAAAHARGGRRGVATHLVTGGVFGVLCVTLSLTAAIAAHVVYNLLVSTVRERPAGAG